MRNKKIFLGMFLILFSVLGILEALGVLNDTATVLGGISFLQIALGIALCIVIVWAILSRRLFVSLLSLTSLFMVFEKNVAFFLGHTTDDIINNWLLALFVVIMYIGIKLLFGKRPFMRIKPINRLSHRRSGNRFNSNEVYIDCNGFVHREISNNLGATYVHFENTESYNGEATLTVENNLGYVEVTIPKSWCVDLMLENNMGNTSNETSHSSGPVLHIVGENNMGTVLIRNS